MMNHEYIVPLTKQTRHISLYLSPVDGGLDGENGQLPEGISSTSHSSSLKPEMHFSSPCFVRGNGVEAEGAVEMACTDSPEIPLDILKNLTVEMLTAGVLAMNQAVRDPAGGNVEFLLVPLLKLLYSLLVMGVLGDEDLGKVLRLIEPNMFPLNGKTIKEEEKEETSDDEQKSEKCDIIKQGLLQMTVPEAVKLEVNETADSSRCSSFTFSVMPKMLL